MWFKELVIDNFLCFRRFKINFAPGVSVIIGRNGSGKTSLIRGMVYSLYFMFTNDRSMGNDFLSAGNPDLKMRSIRYDEFYRGHTAGEVAPDANFHGEMDFGGEKLSWDMYRRSTSGSALTPSRYRPAYQKLMDTYRKENALPLVAYFSDSFPHSLTNISSFAREQMAANGSTLRNFGYYQWDNETACVEIWQMRFINSMMKLQQLADATDPFTRNEVEFVSDRLTRFSKVINRQVCDDAFEIDRLFYLMGPDGRPELWLRLCNGDEVKFNRLPAGYKRLYSIVLDLAYRAYLLNRSAELEPVGVVLVDEVDLHLHPSLETEVVDRFISTFPQLQFIMTSHSPLIVNNLVAHNGKNQVFRLVAGENSPHVLPDLFGIDYDDILIDWMEGHAKNQELEFIKYSFKRAVGMGNKELIDQRTCELKNLVGDDKANKIIAGWLSEH